MASKGLSWDHKTGKGTSLLAALAMILALLPMAATPSVASDDRTGGQAAAVWSSSGWEDSSILAGIDFTDYPGSLYSIGRSIGARTAWFNNADGRGIDVAVIDTGVAPVTGLTGPSKVINGADLSFESQSANFRYTDTYGHGTHMAGIIAGVDPAAEGNYLSASKEHFVGIAPASRIVNVKVGAYDGAVDVSQVIAAIDWVIQHKNDNGMNIRVLNLSYGTDSIQPYQVDPLAEMVERAWEAGIVVVVAAGNDGNAAPLRNPAYDPFVIAVGSAQYGDFNTSNNANVSYDRVSTFSNCGIGRNVDLVAPGKSITGLRVPGSYADDNYPQARIGNRFFLGSGTSQASAIISGAVALMLSADSSLTPDQVKDLLVTNAKPISGVSTACQGAGVVHVGFLGKRFRAGSISQSFATSDGSGSLELSRGSHHVEMDGVTLTGEQDIMGTSWSGLNETITTCVKVGKGKTAETVCTDSLVPVDTLWSGGDWNGTSWSGTSWSGTSWSGTSWSGTSWSGLSWSGTSWSGTSWSNKAWSGTSWSGTSWSGTSWSGTSWSGLSWSSSGSAADNGVRWD